MQPSAVESSKKAKASKLFPIVMVGPGKSYKSEPVQSHKKILK